MDKQLQLLPDMVQRQTNHQGHRQGELRLLRTCLDGLRLGAVCCTGLLMLGSSGPRARGMEQALVAIVRPPGADGTWLLSV